MKKLLVIGLVVLAGLWVVRRTHLASYASTLWCSLRQEVKNQVPVKFELARIQHEIDQMDNDIKGMADPIAEHRVSIIELKEDIAKTRASLATQKTSLLTMTTSLQKGGDPIRAGQVRRQMQRDFSTYKLLEGTLATQEKLLAAKERAHDAAREQLNKLISKKREFTVQLAQLVAEQQLLDVDRTGTNFQVDDSRATQIQEALNGVRHQQLVTREKVRLLTGQVATDDVAAPEQPGASADEVRNYLQGHAPHRDAQTASRK